MSIKGGGHIADFLKEEEGGRDVSGIWGSKLQNLLKICLRLKQAEGGEGQLQ